MSKIRISPVWYGETVREVWYRATLDQKKEQSDAYSPIHAVEGMLRPLRPIQHGGPGLNCWFHIHTSHVSSPASQHALRHAVGSVALATPSSPIYCTVCI